MAQGDVLKDELPSRTEGRDERKKDDFEHPGMLCSLQGNRNGDKDDGNVGRDRGRFVSLPLISEALRSLGNKQTTAVAEKAFSSPSNSCHFNDQSMQQRAAAILNAGKIQPAGAASASGGGHYRIAAGRLTGVRPC